VKVEKLAKNGQIVQNSQPLGPSSATLARPDLMERQRSRGKNRGGELSCHVTQTNRAIQNKVIIKKYSFTLFAHTIPQITCLKKKSFARFSPTSPLENKREVRSFPFCFFLFVKNVFLFSVFH